MTARAVTLHRVFTSTPERVFRAFTTPAAMAKWLPPNGFVAEVQQMDARAGGSWHMSFTALGTGHSHGFGGRYLDFEPGQLLRYTATFDDPQLPGEMQTTVTLRAVSCGVELNVVQEGIPEVIPLEGCTLGWQESLALLKLLVEAEIPG